MLYPHTGARRGRSPVIEVGGHSTSATRIVRSETANPNRQAGDKGSMDTTSAERNTQANLTHEEYIALCKSYGESYSTLTEAGRDEILAEIIRYVEGLAHSRRAKFFDRFANEDEYEAWLLKRLWW